MKVVAKSPAQRGVRKRILVVNGVSLWREALTSTINKSPDLEVCGEAFDEKSAYQMTAERTRQTAETASAVG
jgi:DNA-binding NarL/FixJ family response regulator